MPKKRTPSFLKKPKPRLRLKSWKRNEQTVPVIDLQIETRQITTSRRSIPLPMGHATALAHAPNPEVHTHADIVARFPKEHPRLPRGTLVRQVGTPAAGRRTPRLLGMVVYAAHMIGTRHGPEDTWVTVQWMGADGTTVSNPKFLAEVTDDQVRPLLAELSREQNPCVCSWCTDLKRSTGDQTRRSNHCRGLTLPAGRRIKGLGISGRGVGKKD